MYSFSYLEPVRCSMSSSNCCLLTFIQVSQEAGQVVWYSHQIRSDQSLSRVRLFVTSWIAARQASLSITNYCSSLRLTSIESVMTSKPSHSLLSPSAPAPTPSQHQSLVQGVNGKAKVAKVLEFQLQHHSFQRNPRADLLQNGLVGSPCRPRDSQESSPTP